MSCHSGVGCSDTLNGGWGGRLGSRGAAACMHACTFRLGLALWTAPPCSYGAAPDAPDWSVTLVACHLLAARVGLARVGRAGGAAGQATAPTATTFAASAPCLLLRQAPEPVSTCLDHRLIMHTFTCAGALHLSRRTMQRARAGLPPRPARRDSAACTPLLCTALPLHPTSRRHCLGIWICMRVLVPVRR